MREVFELENTGFTRMNTNRLCIDLDGMDISDVKESISMLRLMFGENFEKLDEWEQKYGERN